MKKWDYQVVHTFGKGAPDNIGYVRPEYEFVKLLCRFGRQGWKVIHSDMTQTDCVALLEREVPETPAPKKAKRKKGQISPPIDEDPSCLDGVHVEHHTHLPDGMEDDK